MNSNKRWSICSLDVLMDCLLWNYYLCLRFGHFGWLSSDWNIPYVNILLFLFLWNTLSAISVWILIQYLYEQNEAMLFRVFSISFNTVSWWAGRNHWNSKLESYGAHRWTVQRIKRKVASFNAVGVFFILHGIYQWQFCLKYDWFFILWHFWYLVSGFITFSAGSNAPL